MRASWEFPEEKTWSDQSLGWLLLNEPVSMLHDSRLKHQHNPNGVLQYYKLLEKDPDDLKEFEHSLTVFESIANQGGVSLWLTQWGELRRAIYKGSLVGKDECKPLARNLGFQLESGNVRADGFAQILEVIASMPDYASERLGKDMLKGYVKNMKGSDGTLSKSSFPNISIDDSNFIENLSEKINLLTNFFSTHAPNNEIFLSALILNSTVKETHIIKSVYDNKPTWLHHQLPLCAESPIIHGGDG